MSASIIGYVERRATRWTEECTAILKRMSAGGYTDQEIADHIEHALGLEFERRTVLRKRQERHIAPCWAASRPRPSMRRSASRA